MSSLNIRIRVLFCLFLSVLLASCGSGGGGGGTSTSTPPAATSPWTIKLAPPTRRDYAAAAVYNNKLYLVGGQLINTDNTYGAVTGLVEIYDPATNTWDTGGGTPIPAMPTARMGLMVVVANNKIYAIGGSDGVHSTGLATVEEFVPGMTSGTGTWTARNPVSTGRIFGAAAPLAVALDQHIVVAGGESGGASLGTMEKYNPLIGSSLALNPLPTPRGRLVLVASGLKLYGIGGYSSASSQWVGTVEEYDSTTSNWATRAVMPTVRGHAASAALSGQLLVAGGESTAGRLAVLESYDPSVDRWTTKTPAPSAFTRAASGVVGNKLYIFGDGVTLEYDPAKETL